MPPLDDRIEFRIPKQLKKTLKAAALIHGFDDIAPWARARLIRDADYDISHPPAK